MEINWISIRLALELNLDIWMLGVDLIFLKSMWHAVKIY